MMKLARVILCTCLAAPALPAIADGHGRAYVTGWHGDIRHFHERDLARWRRGHWYHGPHRGRYGWWWVAGGTWYLYPAPVYPYPDPYLPPPVVAAPPPPPPPARPTYWYYCPSPPGYYPYVPQCRVRWQRVPAVAR